MASSQHTRDQKSLDPFPGEAPINPGKIKKYKRGSAVNIGKRSKYFDKVYKKREVLNRYSIKQAARSELLLPEEAGFLEADEGENTYEYSQHEISKSVDITSSTKYFDLKLKFGPYCMDYTKNGRQLVIGGNKGHVAAIDWISKKLLCEINVMESVHDVQWLHLHTMFAAAQKSYVHIYDNQGIELHCIKSLFRVINMEYLPYHFLLATASDNGFLSWLDVSIGKMVTQYNAKMGYLNLMTQNPYNAIVLTGHSSGVVSMWSPNNREPVVKMLCHKKPLRAISVDPTGKYLATSAVNGYMNIWDIRTFKQLQSYKLGGAVSKMCFSQRGLLAVAMGNTVEIYKDCCQSMAEKPYLRHKSAINSINDMKFCPYEDVLGFSHEYGFSSILTPGSGEPNFDTFESNPYMTKNQRREMEVKMLLDKIQPELICLDPSKLGEVDKNSYEEKLEAKNKFMTEKPPKTEVELKFKNKGKSGSSKKFQRKTIVKEQAKKDFIKEKMKERATDVEDNDTKTSKPRSVLDRFKK